MKLNKFITIVIVSYKSNKLVINFVRKIEKRYKIIIVDNSYDLKLKKEINQKYKNAKVYLKDNIGYGAAANFARKKINTKYFCLCNPDIINFDKNLFESFYKAANKLKEKFLCIGPSYKIEKKKINKNKIKRVNSISGACMFINCEVFDKIGGFDENIFLYFEENDLCKRGNKLNFFSYRLLYVIIHHEVGKSVIIKNLKEKKKLKNLTLWHFIWSKYYFYKKHYGEIMTLLIFTPVIIRIYFKILINILLKNNENLQKYKIRQNGLFASILGKKSFKRIK